jgi:predicted Abi (CAAX) family protease
MLLTPQHWCMTGELLVCYGLLAVPIGWRTGFLQPRLMAAPLSHYLIVPTTLLVLPSLLEEVVFRVLLVPHPTESLPHTRLMVETSVSLLLFVAWHPVNGWLVSPVTRPILTDRRFLFLATLLGAICTLAYRWSGSLWPPVLIHWLVVTLWVTCFGGHRAGMR